MSYRVQIDVYGDRDKNREQTEQQEKKGDKWIKGIVLAFLTVMFIFYTKEMFTRTLMDRTTSIKVEDQGATTDYIHKSGVIRVVGEKDRAAEAKLSLESNGIPTETYTMQFSNPDNWEHSIVTIRNEEGVAVYSKQYSGFHKAQTKFTDDNNSLTISHRYETMVALAFREGTRLRGNFLLYGAVWLIIILEFISLRLWKWFFFRYKIKWAVDRDTIPSHAYNQTILLARFTLFLLMLFLTVKSYVV